MVEHAKREITAGVLRHLSGKEKTVEKAFELKNTEESPVQYFMSPRDQMKVFEKMERESMEVVAIYHSHPHTIPSPPRPM